MQLYIIDRYSTQCKQYLKKLCNTYKRSECSYSKSYSGNLMVLIFSDKGRVGIDVEKVVFRTPDVCRYFYNQFISFEIVQVDDSIETFYKAWTAMESFYKYTRKGFYSTKKFKLDLSKNIVQNAEEAIYLRYISYKKYMICISCEKTQMLENMKVIDWS